MQSLPLTRASRGAVARIWTGILAGTVAATAYHVWPDSIAVASPFTASCYGSGQPRVGPVDAREDSSPPPNRTVAGLQTPPLDRVETMRLLEELVRKNRIDAAMQWRALDVLFPSAVMSENDTRLASVFRDLVNAPEPHREELLLRLSNDVVRALDVTLRNEVWEVALRDEQPRRHPDLAWRAPALDEGLKRLEQMGYPLQIRDIETGIVFRLVPGGYIPRPDGTRGEFVEPFYIAKSEVDWCDWFRVRGGNMASPLPVEGRSWTEVLAYVEKTGLSLPTKAEWEFAARAGIATDYWMGDRVMHGVVRCDVGDAGRAADLQGDQYPRNLLALLHVHGNVAEWCTHPLGSTASMTQPACGGSYRDSIESCKANSAKLLPIGERDAARGVGFRPVRRIRPGATQIVANHAREPLRVVVVEDAGAIDDHWRVKIWRHQPDSNKDRLDPEYCARIVATGLPWEVEDLETGVRMRLVPSGEFLTRGTSLGEPSFRVLIRHPFYLGVSEITHADWSRLLPEDADTSKSRLPIDGVTWERCRTYLRQARTALRFPNEFEWQLACNLGREQPFAWDDEARVRSSRSYCNPEFGPLLPAGEMLESPFGFRGMHGNAREWCLNPADLDGLIPDLEDRLPLRGASTKAVRGGGTKDPLERCHASARLSGVMDDGRAGLRIARSAPKHLELLVLEWPPDARRRPDDVERPRPSDAVSPVTPSDDGGQPEDPREGAPRGPVPAKQVEDDEPADEDESDRGIGGGKGQERMPGKGPRPDPGQPADGNRKDSTPRTPRPPTEPVETRARSF